jgi:hypothetical protein
VKQRPQRKPPISGRAKMGGTRRWQAGHATAPSPEGMRGGANGEVSWLRASARLPGLPVAC